MPLSKEDRISFSKRIVTAEPEKAQSLASKASIQEQRDIAYNLDQGNKRLADRWTDLINPYQVELGRYTGVFRTELTEQDIQDSANRVLGNFLYPNDPQNPPPSTAPLVWTKATPYARNKAVGKAYDENYPAPTTAEKQYTDNILTLINKIETDYTLIQRVSGQICTPGMPDTISTYAALQTDYNDLLTNVNGLKSYLLATQGLILTTDENPRQAENNTAISNINTIVAAIDVWLALTPFNTGHGQTTCAGFNSYNPALLGPTRLQSGNLTTFKNAMLSRESFRLTREGQINGYLGDITQDISTGNVTGTGFYINRWNFVVLRLNFFGGSLIALAGFDTALNAIDQRNDQIDLAKNSYSTILTTSLLSAPTNGTKNIWVKSSAGFLAGDTVYIISETQEELKRTIESVDGNRLVLGREISAKYRPEEIARVYKDLT